MSPSVSDHRRQTGGIVDLSAGLAPNDSLPHPLTSFVGREDRIATVRELLAREDVRVLTLTGPGGVGKTRLALKVVEDTLHYPDGIWFVALASIQDPALVASAIARVVGVVLNPGRTTEQNLIVHLLKARALFILDNFEQVVDAGYFVAHLLEACPGLDALVTSRVNLRISGEHVYSVPPLDVLIDPRLDLARVEQNESVRLFVDRAKASTSVFELTSCSVAAVVNICDRLEGLPLAIELAASRVNVLSPGEILSRIDERLSLLTGGARDQPLRMQSLYASIAWSYDLLTDNEQALFRRLSVFAGTWTIGTAEAIISILDGHPQQATVEELTSLVDNNLVRQQTTPEGGSRYSMLETIREFALAQLELHDEANGVREAHATFFQSVAEEGESHLVHNVDPAWLERLEAEHGNFRIALNWAFRTDQSVPARARGVLLASALWLFWYYHSHLAEGRRWLELAVEASRDTPNEARTKVLLGLGTLLHYQGEKGRAKLVLSEGLELSQRLNDRWTTAHILTACGNLAEDEGRYEEASIQFGDARRLFSETGDEVNVAVTLYHLGVVAFGVGDLDLSIQRCQDALELARATNDPWTTAASLAYLGLVRCARGELKEAGFALDEAIAIYRRIESPERIAEVLCRTAVLARAMGQSHSALRLFAAAESIGERIGVRHELPELEHYERTLSAIKESIPRDDFASEWAAGRQLSMVEAIAVAQSVLDGNMLDVGDRASWENPPSAFELTSREREVLRLLAHGKTDRQIAEILSISRRTASTHLSHIYGKLGVSTRAGAAAVAVRAGLD